MSSHSKISTDNAIRFGDRVAGSAAFKTLFRDGMALVEETAAYLDGRGREDARQLPRTAALAYAAESMRLTTRLMQIASWLLVQRAVNEGEMTLAEAASDKHRAQTSWGAGHALDNPALPAPLVGLIEASLRLQERIVHLDTLIREPITSADDLSVPPVAAQLSRLRAAFPGSP